MNPRHIAKVRGDNSQIDIAVVECICLCRRMIKFQLCQWQTSFPQFQCASDKAGALSYGNLRNFGMHPFIVSIGGSSSGSVWIAGRDVMRVDTKDACLDPIRWHQFGFSQQIPQIVGRRRDLCSTPVYSGLQELLDSLVTHKSNVVHRFGSSPTKDAGSLQRPVAHTGSYTMEATLLFLALGSQLCELPDAEAIRRLMSKNLRKDAVGPTARSQHGPRRVEIVVCAIHPCLYSCRHHLSLE